MINYDNTNTIVNSITYDLSENQNPLKLLNVKFKLEIEVSYVYQNEKRYLTGHDSFFKFIHWTSNTDYKQ